MATAAGRGTGYDVTVRGLDESLSILTRAGAELHGLDSSAVRLSNSTLRYEAGRLAGWLAQTTIAPLVRAGPAPQSAALAATVRPKIDRMIVVRIGATNPRQLSGFRAGRGGNAKYRGSLAYGVERGRYPGSRDYYTLPRRAAGYVIGPNMTLIASRALPPYRELVKKALVAAGVTSFGKAV